MNAWTKYREEVWREAAERRGGTFWPKESWTKPAYAAVPLRGGTARLDRYYANKLYYARIVVPLTLRLGPTFWVARDNVLGRIAKALRLVRDVELGGDAEFDRRFVVKCQREEETRLAWTAEAKQLALAMLGRMELFRAGYSGIQSDGATLRLWWPETDMSPFRRYSVGYAKEVELGLSLLDALSGFGQDVLERMRALPDAHYCAADPSGADPSPPRVEADTAFGSVRVWPAWQPWGLALAISSASTRGLPPFSFEVAPGGGLLGAPPPELVAPAAADELASVGQATLVSDGREVRLFVGARLEPERLVSASRAVGIIASGAATSAFR